MTDWIAVDWGTTHLRAWAMGAEGPVTAAQSDQGMGTLDRDGFEPALLALIGDWLGPDRTAVVACGMVGSRQGWAEAPYRAVPCPPLAAPVPVPARDARLRVGIVPGLSQASPADVMRGEETQIAGALAARPGFDGVICLPGTHTKWAEISAGEVVSFQTFMTGEMFDLLAHRSVLRHSVGDGWDEPAFAEAVAEALSRPAALAARLFGLRAEGLLQGLAPGTAAARLSGALIGAELAAARPYWLGQRLLIVGDGQQAEAYATALLAQGARAERLPAEGTTLAGLARAAAALREPAR